MNLTLVEITKEKSQTWSMELLGKFPNKLPHFE
jgi:hypothetical protein